VISIHSANGAPGISNQNSSVNDFADDVKLDTAIVSDAING